MRIFIFIICVIFICWAMSYIFNLKLDYRVVEVYQNNQKVDIICKEFKVPYGKDFDNIIDSYAENGVYYKVTKKYCNKEK